jgi:hypothetical protein
LTAQPSRPERRIRFDSYTWSSSKAYHHFIKRNARDQE